MTLKNPRYRVIVNSYVRYHTDNIDKARSLLSYAKENEDKQAYILDNLLDKEI